MAILQAFAILSFLLFVGQFLYRAFAPVQEKTTLEVLWIQFLAGFLLCGWLALLLAELGLFSLTRLILLLLLICVFLLVLRWPALRRWNWPRPGPLIWRTLLVVLLFLGIFLLWAHPGEPILGGQDPGVYVATGASIAQSGAIVRHDPWLSSLPEQDRSLVLPFYIGEWWQVPGFYVTDFASGEVTPQFLHLYPTWLALFYTVGGLDLALLATPLLALLGLLALFFLVRRWLGQWPALAAVALLALNPGQVWFAREPNAESLTFPLVFAGWYLLDRVMKEPGRRDLATWAGLSLGLVGLTKLEFIVLPAILYVYFMLRAFVLPLRPGEKHFLLVHTVLVGHAAIHLLWIAQPYLSAFRASMENSYFLSFAAVSALGLAALLGVLLLVLLRRPLGRMLGRLLDRPVLSQNTLPTLWLLLAFYGAVLWPLLGPAQLYAYGQWWPNLNLWSFLRMSWYLSPLGFALSIPGLWWWLRYRFRAAALPFFATLFFQLGIYIHTTLAEPLHFWMMRRYVPLIFPCLSIGVAVALWRVRQAPVHPTLRRGGALLLLGLLLLLSVQADAPFASQQELVGTPAFLEGMAAQVPDGAPLLIEPLGAALSAPLRYLYGKAAFSLPQPEISQAVQPVPWEKLWALLQVWPPEGHTAYLLLRDHPMQFYGGTMIQGLGSFFLETSRTERSYDHLPRGTQEIRAGMSLYRLQQQLEPPTLLEVSFDEPAWSGDLITIVLPAPSVPLLLRLKAGGFRPADLPQAQVQVRWAGQPVTERVLERNYEPDWVELWLPPPLSTAAGEQIRLEIVCPTWNPQAVGYSDDARDLGVLLQSITLEETAP